MTYFGDAAAARDWVAGCETGADTVGVEDTAAGVFDEPPELVVVLTHLCCSALYVS